ERKRLAGCNFAVVFRGPASPTDTFGPAGNNVAAGNFLGTDRTGTRVLGNFVGVGLLGDHDDVIGVAGGEADPQAARNVISGNFVGVLVGASSLVRSPQTGIRMMGNYLGTDVTGLRPLGNTSSAVTFVGSSSDN